MCVVVSRSEAGAFWTIKVNRSTSAKRIISVVF